MQDENLLTYLNDHLGASVAGIELTHRCLSNNRNSELGKFLEHLLLVLREEQVRIRKLIRRLGGTESVAKKLGGWALEKVGRLKLNNALFRYSDLSRVVELETLLAGLQAQAGMWRAMEAFRSDDPRFDGIDFSTAKEQSEEMLRKMQEFHAQAAELAFANIGGPNQ